MQPRGSGPPAGCAGLRGSAIRGAFALAQDVFLPNGLRAGPGQEYSQPPQRAAPRRQWAVSVAQGAQGCAEDVNHR